MADVVILVPVLRRPYRAAHVAASAEYATPEGRVLFICSPDDVIEQRACEDTGCDVLVVDWPGGERGDWARKINAGYRATSEPWMLLGADDLVFHPGWFQAAMDCLPPDGVGHRVGVVGTNDLANRRTMTGVHSTHPLVARWYADERGTLTWGDDQGGPGHVVVECYRHNFVDDELVGTAKARRAWQWVQDARIEHRHPTWGTAPDDEVYALGREGWRADKTLHRKRAVMWTGRRIR